MKGSLKTFQIFLVLAVLVVGIAIVAVYFPIVFKKKSCQTAQEDELQNLLPVIEDVQVKPGYRIVYFNVRECVKKFEFNGTHVIITYKIGTTDEKVEVYPKTGKWPTIWVGIDKLNNPGIHTLKVYAHEIIVMD